MAIRFSICNELFEGWPLERVLVYCANLGYEGVEIAPFTLAEDIRGLAPEVVGEMRRTSERGELPGLRPIRRR